MGASLPAALQLQRRKSQKAVLAVDRRRRLLLAARASVLELEFFHKAGDVYHLVSAFDKVSKQVVSLLCVFICRCVSFLHDVWRSATHVGTLRIACCLAPTLRASYSPHGRTTCTCRRWIMLRCRFVTGRCCRRSWSCTIGHSWAIGAGRWECVCRHTEAAPDSDVPRRLLVEHKEQRQISLGLCALRRLLQRLPFTATLGEALLAERLRTALERASAFVLAHEAAARDIGRCRHDFMPLCPSIRLQVHATACLATSIFLCSQVTKLNLTNLCCQVRTAAGIG